MTKILAHHQTGARQVGTERPRLTKILAHHQTGTRQVGTERPRLTKILAHLSRPYSYFRAN